MSNEIFITALCPTYRRPELLANSIWLWEQQTYPAHFRRLLIMDDGGTFDRQFNARWSGHVPGWAWLEEWFLFTNPSRFPSLPAKYNTLAELAPPETHAFLVWEDDDLYLPNYVQSYAEGFAWGAELVKPGMVYSDYPGALIQEAAAGRFHATLGFTKELFQRVGGWPNSKRADFDQQFIQRLQQAAPPHDPWINKSPQYIYGWHTGRPHGQNTMRSGDDETWYERAEDLFPPVRQPGNIEPRPLPRTLYYFKELGISYKETSNAELSNLHK